MKRRWISMIGAVRRAHTLAATPIHYPPPHFVYDVSDIPLLPSLPRQSNLAATFETWPRSLTSATIPVHAVCHHKPVVSLAISGGVDSGVSAFLLREAGFDVRCVYMHNWDEFDELGHCTGDRDIRDAQSIATSLALPFIRLDFVREYWQLVFHDLLTGYKAGYTPNPDVMCNREIKFQALVDRIKAKVGASFLATGHYARTQRVPMSDGGGGDSVDLAQVDEEFDAVLYDSNGTINLDRLLASLAPPAHSPADSAAHATRLLTSRDRIKDQTYFLSLVRHSSLSNVLFPLGSLLKSHTRAIARQAGLTQVSSKADSMGICMIGRRDFASFLSDYIPLTPGRFRCLETGTVIAQHSGCELFTIGQSAGLGGQRHRWYVSSKDLRTGDVYCVNHRLHPALIYDDVYIDKFNWLTVTGRAPLALLASGEMEAFCRLRSTERLRRCRVSVVDDGTDSDGDSAAIVHSTSCDLGDGRRYRVTMLDCPHSMVSPGQTLALYVRGVCLGGGSVARPGPSYWHQRKSLAEYSGVQPKLVARSQLSSQ